jgi:hypothetical protein
MFDNKESRDAADRLGELWDDVTRAGGDVASPGDRDAALAGRLQQMVPPLNDTTRERMRARVLASQRGEAPPMTATPINPGGAIAPLPQQPRSTSRPHRADHPIMRIAAMILLALSIGAVWLGLRSFSGGEKQPTPVQGALFATPNGEDEVAFRETVLLHDVAAVGAMREFTVSIDRVTLPAMSVFDFSGASLSTDANPISFYVESGTLTVVTNGVISSFGPEQASDAGVPDELRVESPEPVTFIMLTLVGGRDIVPVPPADATVESLGKVPVKQPLGSVTTVNFSRTFVNVPGADPISMSGPETVAFVAVNSGSLSVQALAGDRIKVHEDGDSAVMFTPATGDEITLGAGDSVTADIGSKIDGKTSVIGSEMLSAYVLTILQQSPQDIAEQQLAAGASIDWTIPEGASTASMLVRTITLQPGVEWHYPFDGVVQYQGYSGSVSIQLGNSNTQILSTGQLASQSGSGDIVISNNGPGVAVIFQASIAIGDQTTESMGGTLAEGIAINSSAFGQTPVEPGVVTVTLGEQAIDNTSSQSNASELGASLIFVSEGNAVFTPMSGDIEIGRTQSANEIGTPITDEPATSPSTTLLEGDSAMIPQDAAYLITGASEHVSRFIWFSFTPVESEATPTPVANTDLVTTPTPASIAVDEASSPTPTPAPEEAGGMLSPTPTPAS